MNVHSTGREATPVEAADQHDFAVVLIGGGLGSFALASRLRIGGVAAEDICVVSNSEWPDQSFAAQCEASGMLPEDTLRSDSSSRIDNLWGFPSYAVSDAVSRRRLAPLLRVAGEPLLCQYYSPRLDNVRAGIRREAERIGWSDMLLRGSAEQVVRAPEGGYVVRVQTATGTRIVRGDHVHLALGTAGPRISQETSAYRDQTGRLTRIVHAYEPHDHVYDELARRGGDVLVRGAGIASSRVLQRLIDDRETSGHPVRIMQQFRDYRHGRDKDGSSAAWGFRHQPFDLPKAAYGGPLRDELAALPEEERYRRIAELSFVSTPYRKVWAEQLRRGRTEGWYRAVAGHVAAFGPRQGGVRVLFSLPDGATHEESFSYVIDCTGTDPDASRHTVVRDLLGRGMASLNRLAGVRVDDDCAVIGADSGDGRIFATGVIAAGAAIAPMDSFAGLQAGALVIADWLADHGVGSRLTPARSTAAWWRWVRGRVA